MPKNNIPLINQLFVDTRVNKYVKQCTLLLLIKYIYSLKKYTKDKSKIRIKTKSKIESETNVRNYKNNCILSYISREKIKDKSKDKIIKTPKIESEINVRNY